MAAARTYKMTVNGQEFEVDTAEISALQVRVLALVPTSFSLILEQPGSQPDAVLRDNDVIDLSRGKIHIYAHPPTTFGVLCNVDT